MTCSSKFARLGIAMAATALFSGCASTDRNPKDPLEGFNRAMFGFNENVDKYALKPAAQAYEKVLPDVVQTGIGNFFGNIGDVWTAANNLMQGNAEDGMSNVARVMINTMFGLVGVIDVASDAGLPKHREDFGQTLGTWGVKSGPYLVLPFLGSSTVRDTAALPVDFYGDLWLHVYPVHTRNLGTGTRIIDQRAAAMNASTLLEEAALDKYEFVRDAYLQRRKSLIQKNKAEKGGQTSKNVEEDEWVTVNGDNKPTSTVSANQQGGQSGVPGETSPRGSATETPFSFGVLPR